MNSWDITSEQSERNSNHPALTFFFPIHLFLPLHLAVAVAWFSNVEMVTGMVAAKTQQANTRGYSLTWNKMMRLPVLSVCSR